MLRTQIITGTFQNNGIMKSHPQDKGEQREGLKRKWSGGGCIWDVCSHQFPSQFFRGEGGKQQKLDGSQVERERLGLEAAGTFLYRKV